MDDERNLWDFREARTKACVGEVVGISNMRFGELRRLSDIQHKGVSIFTQQGWNGREIHGSKFCDGFRGRGGKRSGREKARDVFEAYADDLANKLLRSGGIFRDEDNLLLRRKVAAREVGEFLRRGEEAAAKVAFQKLVA